MNADEFKRIFLPSHQSLYRFAYKLTGNQEDAEDLVQETFMKLWNSRDRIGEPENPTAFSMTVLKNTFLDNTRRRREEAARASLDEIESTLIVSDTDVGRLAESRDSVRLVLTLIDHLPANQRDVIRMREIADSSFEQIQAATGLSPGNIRTLLSRARKKIKEQYTALLSYER